MNRPESALIGVMFEGNPVDQDIVINEPKHWVLSGTGLRAGDRIPGLLGYEADQQFGQAPRGTIVIAHSPYQDQADGETDYADMTVYRHVSGAEVFAARSIQWSWGLDDFNVPDLRGSRLSPPVQQMTRNVLAHLAGDAFPTAVLHGQDQGSAGVPVQFDASSSSDRDGRILRYHWAFGNGQESEAVRPAPVYDRPGRYRVRLTVTDDRGAAGHATADLLMIEPPSGDVARTGRAGIQGARARQRAGEEDRP